LAKPHRIILNPIRDRDAEAAEAWMRRRIVDSRRGHESAHLNMATTVDLLTP
jgi:DNA-binding GntR family transcriptional regulator